MTDYQKGFDDAIDRVLTNIDVNINSIASIIEFEANKKQKHHLKIRLESFIDIKRLIIELFKMVAAESKAHD